ncbi:MAG: hypothetical protein IJ272_03335 [Clostridia bacterium]|nr:hypothetical protein [Clostridia bacterium]
MHNLRRFYYRNKDKIWKVVLIIAFVLGIIYLLDSIALDRINEKNNTIEIENEIYENTDTQTYIEKESAISGSTVTKAEVNKINQTISKFLQYCKTGNTQEAYNMLSNDCKENHYKTIEEFENRYMKKKYSNNNVFEIQKWINNTYKVSILTDMLSTGEVGGNEKIEYITTVTEDNVEKLNVNEYIGEWNINKQTTQNNIEVTVLKKQMYKDYEIYDFKIKNLSEKTIMLDSLQKIGTMYLEDTNKIKYNAYAHEKFEPNLEIKPNEEKSISIKYANPYTTRVTIKEIVFENIISDYITYKTSENKKEYEDTYEVTIKL